MKGPLMARYSMGKANSDGGNCQKGTLPPSHYPQKLKHKKVLRQTGSWRKMWPHLTVTIYIF